MAIMKANEHSKGVDEFPLRAPFGNRNGVIMT